MAGNMDLGQVLNAAQLPALPQSAIRLLELSKNPSLGPADYAVPIESDPGLASQVLKFVNSSYFGFAREIASVKLALNLVGVRTIKNFALWSAVFSLVPSPKCGALDLRVLWQDSLRRALLARTVGRILGMRDAEEPFAAALLQDMAVPLLVKETPQVYPKLLAAREGGRLRLSALESQVFGWTHAEAAARMARTWNLPEELAALLESHTAIDELIAQPRPAPGTLAVALSSLLPALADPQWMDCRLFEGCYLRAAGSNGPSVEELLDEVDRQFAGFAPVLKVGSPRKSLLDCYHDALALI